MVHYIDLTHPLRDGTVGYPGDPGVRISRAHDHDEHGYRVAELHIGSHVGTHIDVPLHVDPEGHDVAASSLGTLIGPAIVIDLGEVAPCTEIGPELVGPVEAGARILLKTGWATRFGTASYHQDFPQISVALAEHLVQSGIALLGIEQPSLHHTEGLAIHHRLLGAGIPIVEGLRLTQLHVPSPEIVILPLPVEGADGSPVRAIAVVP